MALLLDVKLALSKCVPELDSPIAATTNDLSVVGGEGDGKHIGGVSNEAAGGDTSV